jgi:regulator of sigma E protease
MELKKRCRGLRGTLALLREAPLGPRSPVSVPALGIAYRVDPMVEEVEDVSSPLQKNDVVSASGFRSAPRGVGQGRGRRLGPRVPAVQRLAELRPVKFEVERAGAVIPVEVTPAPDVTWPRADLGLSCSSTPAFRGRPRRRGDGDGAARHRDWIKFIVLSLKQMMVGNISYMQMGGPVTIGVTAYSAAGMGFWEFVFVLGLISINLAVINFLPVPFLDGGHMMFLTYEALRGKPAPEMVQTVATLGGVLFLISVMVFVFYLDLM